MSARRWMVGWGLAIAAGVFVYSFYSQLGLALGACGEDASFDTGSELDRFCDGPLVTPGVLVAAVTVVLVGTAVSVWMVRAGPLVAGTFLAVAIAFAPLVVFGEQSDKAPAASADEPDPGPEPVISRPDPKGSPVVSGPGRGRLPVDQEAGIRAQGAVEEVFLVLYRCLHHLESRSECDDPALWEPELSADERAIATYRVEVLSDSEWRVSSRTRKVFPTHAYSAYGKHFNGGPPTRLVRTCRPTGITICEAPGRRAEGPRKAPRAG